MSTRALYGLDGDAVTLAEFIYRQGGQTDWKQWTVLPYCQYDICHAPMQPYDKGGALGTYYGGRAKPPDRPVDRRSIGFAHQRRTAHKKCPGNFANDPRFDYLTRYAYTNKDFEANRIVLAMPAVERGSWAVMDFFNRRLTGHPINRKEHEELQAAYEEQTNVRGMDKHAWAAAFRAMMFRDAQKRKSPRNGIEYYVVLKGVGEQNLEYLDRRREAETNRDVRHLKEFMMPAQLQLYLVDKWTGEITPQRDRQNHQIIRFDVSPNAWKDIARTHAMPAPVQHRLSLRRKAKALEKTA